MLGGLKHFSWSFSCRTKSVCFQFVHGQSKTAKICVRQNHEFVLPICTARFRCRVKQPVHAVHHYLIGYIHDDGISELNPHPKAVVMSQALMTNDDSLIVLAPARMWGMSFKSSKVSIKEKHIITHLSIVSFYLFSVLYQSGNTWKQPLNVFCIFFWENCSFINLEFHLNNFTMKSLTAQRYRCLFQSIMFSKWHNFNEYFTNCIGVYLLEIVRLISGPSQISISST